MPPHPASPGFVAQFVYTPDEFVRGMRATYKGLVPAFVFFTLLISLASFARAETRPGLVFWIGQTAVTLILAALVALGWQYLIGYLGLRVYRSKPRDWQTLTVTVSEEALRLQGLGRDIVAPWARIRSVRQRGDLYVILLPNYSRHFIPERPLAEQGSAATFRSFVQTKLGSRARWHSSPVPAAPKG